MADKKEAVKVDASEKEELYGGNPMVYADALENMKNVRKLIKDRLKTVEQNADIITDATATEKVRLQGTKETKAPDLKPYTEAVDVKDRAELSALVEKAKKDKKVFKIGRSMKEGFRYTFLLEEFKDAGVFVYRGGKVSAEDVSKIKVVHFAKDFKGSEIPGFAFDGCVNLEEIYIPSTITNIGINAFKGCEKVKIFMSKRSIKVYPNNADFIKSRLNYIEENKIPLVESKLKEEFNEEGVYVYRGGKVAEQDKPNVKVVHFAKDFTGTEIPGFAFAGCVNLEEIYLPETIERIGINAFKGCEKVIIFASKGGIMIYPSDMDFLKTRVKYVGKSQIPLAEVMIEAKGTGHKVGDTVKIIMMAGEPKYAGKIGKITKIDDAGQLHGTWGGLALIPGEDQFEILDIVNEKKMEAKHAEEETREVKHGKKHMREYVNESAEDMGTEIVTFEQAKEHCKGMMWDIADEKLFNTYVDAGFKFFVKGEGDDKRLTYVKDGLVTKVVDAKDQLVMVENIMGAKMMKPMMKEGGEEHHHEEDKGEYDEEGDMAKSDLQIMADAALELHGMLADEENLPEWVQAKITLASDYIDTARDYMKAKKAGKDFPEPKEGEEEIVLEPLGEKFEYALKFKEYSFNVDLKEYSGITVESESLEEAREKVIDIYSEEHNIKLKPENVTLKVKVLPEEVKEMDESKQPGNDYEVVKIMLDEDGDIYIIKKSQLKQAIKTIFKAWDDYMVKDIYDDLQDEYGGFSNYVEEVLLKKQIDARPYDIQEIYEELGKAKKPLEEVKEMEEVLVEPKKGETEQEYVSRFMGSKQANKDFPNQKQRAAVAYSKFRGKKEELVNIPEPQNIQQTRFFAGDDGDTEAHIFVDSEGIENFDLRWDDKKGGYTLSWEVRLDEAKKPEIKKEVISTTLTDDGVLKIFLGNSILAEIEDGKNTESFIKDTLHGMGYIWNKDGTVSKKKEEGKKPLEEKKLKEETKIITELGDFNPWSGAVSTWDLIVGANKVDALDFLLEDLYPEGIGQTELNDLLWFEADWVLDMLGISRDEVVSDEEEPAGEREEKTEVEGEEEEDFMSMLNDLDEEPVVMVDEKELEEAKHHKEKHAEEKEEKHEMVEGPGSIVKEVQDFIAKVAKK